MMCSSRKYPYPPNWGQQKFQGEGGPKGANIRGGGGGFLRSFFRGLQVRLASYCSSAVAHCKLLAKRELYKAKLSLLDHVLTWIRKIFSLYIRNNYISHNGIVQQHFWRKYSLQSCWKIMEIPGSSRVWQAPHGMEIPRGWGSKAKVPSFWGGDIFWNYTIRFFHGGCWGY